MGERVLVTGGAGYIGSHTCKVLAEHGFEPISYDNLVYGHPQAVKWGPLEEGDIRDFDRLSAIVSKYRPQAIMHFAAYALVGESMSDPLRYYGNNVDGSMTLLGAMLACGVDKIIFSSTCATYGMPTTVPISDAHRQTPINPYGRSKLIVENLLRDYGTAYGVKSCALRYFNAAGADPDGELGEDHDPETHLIPNVLLAAAGKRRDVTINGDDYETPDGTCIRDYIHVTDLAEAHVLALETLKHNAGFHRYNLGNEVGHSITQIMEAAQSVCGRTIPYQVGPRRPGDPPVLIADSARARAELGWRPRYNELEQIVETAWRWFSKTE